MSQTEPEISVPLQPPGAGLPPVELFISRIGFRLLKLFVSQRGASKWFRSEAEQILTLARTLAPAEAARRVLIPRLPGLEDSSRYWSVDMTLEHLVIVNTATVGVIEALAAGRTINHVVSTADVKPSATPGPEMIERFEATARDYLARVEAIPDLRSKVTLKHPWFGPFTALNWHRLAALHHRIHRKQIERIIGLLPQAAKI